MSQLVPFQWHVCCLRTEVAAGNVLGSTQHTRKVPVAPRLERVRCLGRRLLTESERHNHQTQKVWKRRTRQVIGLRVVVRGWRRCALSFFAPGALW